MPKYDYSMLRGRIRELFGSEKNFLIELKKELKKVGISISSGTFNSRINGTSYFKQPEMEAICQLLRINIIQLNEYFFTSKYEFNSYKN